MNYTDYLKSINDAIEIWKKEAEKWLHKRAKEIIEEESEKFDTLKIIKEYMIDKQAQDERWNKLSQEEREGLMEAYKRNPDSCLFSTRYFGSHNLNPQPLTYEDVARELFEGKRYYRPNGCMDNRAYEEAPKHDYQLYSGINCVSDEQGRKIIAINKLLNVATFLNKNEDGTRWKPDWENMTQADKVWSLGIDEGKIRPYYVDKYGAKSEIVYFKTMFLAEQAKKILGEDTVSVALGEY